MDYQRIAVAVDFSEPSRHALRQAGRMAERSSGTILAIHVAEEDAVQLFARELQGDPAILQSALERQLTQWASEGVGPGVPVEVRVLSGSPSRDIHRLCREFHADLLVSGTKGNSHPNRRLGTLAGILVRQAEIPVLLVNPAANPPRTVVACVDYSGASSAVMDHALAMAETEDLELHVIHNEPPAGDYYAHLATASGLEPYAVAVLDPETLRRIDAGHLTRLQEFTATYQRESKPRIQFALTQNFSAARGIVEYAAQLTAPLIVMGTHGRSGLTRSPRRHHGRAGSPSVSRQRTAGPLPTCCYAVSQFPAIVVGVDFSPPSAAALEEAGRLAAWEGAHLIIAHAVHDDLLAAACRYTGLGPEEILAGRRMRLDRFCLETLGTRTVPSLEFKVLTGHPFVQLIRLVEREEASLLVLGAQGESHRDSRQLGTLASSCVRHAPCEALLVRATNSGGFRRVVVAVDLNPGSRRALRQAAGIIRAEGGELHIAPRLRSRLESLCPGTGRDPDLPAQLAAYVSRVEHQVASFVRTELPDISGLATTIAVRESDNRGGGIVRYANEAQADLVILGCRPTGSGRFGATRGPRPNT